MQWEVKIVLMSHPHSAAPPLRAAGLRPEGKLACARECLGPGGSGAREGGM